MTDEYLLCIRYWKNGKIGKGMENNTDIVCNETINYFVSTYFKLDLF
jgi:hypothetical protein